jgi:hypothetical protein
MAIAFDKRSVGYRFRILRGRTASGEGSRIEAEGKPGSDRIQDGHAGARRSLIGVKAGLSDVLYSRRFFGETACKNNY